MPVLEAVNVTKTFMDGEVRVAALRGVNLTVEHGEMLAIVGRSGSGKSTLLSLLGAVETPTTGQILLEGKDLAKADDDQRTLLRRRRIGFVFQAFNLIPTLTALENVALPLELDGVSESVAQERAAAMLKLVELSARHSHFPSMMSGGEQQRVAVARSLVIEPALVLADEPTGNLDSIGSQQVVRLLRDLVDRQGQTVVLVTHDMQVADVADRIVRMADGRIVSVEAPAERPRPATAAAR